MAEGPQERRNPQVGRATADHELGTRGDQDIVKGPLASDDDRFVRVGTADNPFAADLIASALGDAGIPVAARAQRDHLLDTLVNPNGPAWVVMVPERSEAVARGIVDRCHAELVAQQPEMERAAEEEERAGEQPVDPAADRR